MKHPAAVFRLACCSVAFVVTVGVSTVVAVAPFVRAIKFFETTSHHSDTGVESESESVSSTP